jgi:hypothetical protein
MTMQLALPIEDLPQPSEHLWNQLDELVRQDAIEKLAQLVARTAQSMPNPTEAADE